MANHKLVFKNTLFLYARVFLSMAIGLYTSRVILKELGVDDFGIYSVVGSLSMLFAYLNYGISSSLQRFMSCEIAADSRSGLQKCFSSSLQAAIYLSLILVFLCETVGLWALREIIDIPAGHESDALFVFQISVAILVLELFKTCCISLIISHEKMSFFAYISIVESLLKLGVALMLMAVGSDKLRTYALLLLGVSVVVLSAHVIYCRRNFPRIQFSLKGGSERLREIFSFTGWNTLASFADLCYMQGTNIVLNVFYGVAYNATMGITTQVKNALYSFSRNLQTASFPHLIKEFAQEDFKSFSRLAITISVLSCLLLYLFGLPILLNTETILDIWLVNIPPRGATFIRLIILFCMVDSLVGPLWVGMQAYGNIRTYQLIMSTGWMLSLPTMWLALRLGGSPECVLQIQVLFNLMLLAIRIGFAVRYCHIDLREYVKNVLLRLVAAMILAGIIPLCIAGTTEGYVRLLLTTAASLATVPLFSFFVAFPKAERQSIINFAKSKLKHGKH